MTLFKMAGGFRRRNFEFIVVVLGGKRYDNILIFSSGRIYLNVLIPEICIKDISLKRFTNLHKVEVSFSID